MKYELTLESKVVDDLNLKIFITLYRIRALKDFSNIKKGDLGGWIEKERNLSQEGDCWVFENARVYDNAMVYGNARIFGEASVCGNAEVCGDAWVCGGMISGNAIVYENAMVYGNARIYGNAIVRGNAYLHGDAQVFGDDQVFGHNINKNTGIVTKSTSAPLADNLKVPEEVIRPKTISAIHWLDVCTE